MTKRTTTWSRDVPIEIVTDILSRLPSKSLLRFRCVCKSWLHLITDRKFIQLHRNLNKNGHVLIQYELHNYPVTESIFSLHCDKTFVVEQARLELPSRKFDYVGCSNGLVCLSCSITSFVGFFSEICLWNPSIRKLKVLPRGSLSDFYYEQTNVVVAFGFVPQMNDYRVLKIVQGCDHDGKIPLVGVKAEIYSLSTNSWKLVENMVRCREIKHNSKALSTVNGVIHFVANDMASDDVLIILSFDMAEETFSEISMIREFKHSFMKYGVYPVLIGEIFLVLCHNYEPETGDDVVDILEKIKEPGAAECWTTKLTIDHLVQPLGFLKNGELVWTYLDQVTSYDPRLSPEIKNLQFGGVPGRLCLFTEYMESLILLDDQGD